MSKRVEHLGRYTLHGELAAGGMATVHLGRLLGPAGFARTVAIKRLHPQFAKDPAFVAMLLDEARIASRLRHTNVVPILDVVAAAGEVFLVIEYVHGESLSRLAYETQKQGLRVDPRIAVAVVVGALHGLHAAHETRGEDGAPLAMVHRDVSPQNVLVGVDGIARVLDFGIAKAAGRLQTTHDGHLKGKIAYMAPEMLVGAPVDRRADVWAAGAVLWELLTGRMLFAVDSPAAGVHQVMTAEIPAPSAFGAPHALDAVVAKALSRPVDARFATARDMAVALEEALAPATARTVGEWVEATAAESLSIRAKLIAAVEAGGRGSAATDPTSVRTKLRALGVPTDGESATNEPPSVGIHAPSDTATERVDVRGAGPPPPAPDDAAPASPGRIEQAPSSELVDKRVHGPRLRAAFLLAFVIAGVIALGVASRLHQSTGLDSPSLPSGGAASDVVDVTGTSTPAASVEPPTASSSAGDAGIASPVDAAPHPLSAVTSIHSRPAAAPRPPPSSTTAAACDPPFRIVDGIRVPKRECL